MDDLNSITTYINDINNSLRNAKEQDIMVLFKELYDKEQSFAKKLKSTGAGRNVYVKFIKKILNSQGGIKVARSYFRARQDSYLNTVNKAIRDMKPELMYDVPINYRFCSFAIESLQNKDRKLAKLFEEIKNLRDEITNKHLFLSLNRAKVFKSASYGSFSEFEDLIQLANEALVVAVDKYVMDEDSSSFHVMVIGRIISNLITNGETASAATMGEHSRKKLYQIRKILQNNPNFSTKEISDISKISQEEISELLGATSYKSLDDTVGDSDSDTRLVDTFISNIDGTKEDQHDLIEKSNLLSVLSDSFDVLSVLEIKVLRLKGVQINENNE
jgi:DNA-directed RNA polymerase specialized sigma subunit